MAYSTTITLNLPTGSSYNISSSFTVSNTTSGEEISGVTYTELINGYVYIYEISETSGFTVTSENGVCSGTSYTAEVTLPTATPTPTATGVVPTATPTPTPTETGPIATATPTPTPTPTATPLYYIFDACEEGGTTVYDELGAPPSLGTGQLYVDYVGENPVYYTWNGNTANDTGGFPIVDLQPYTPQQTGCALPPTPTPSPTPQQLQTKIQECGNVGPFLYVTFTNQSSLPVGFALKSQHPQLTGSCWEIIDNNWTGSIDFTTTVDGFPYSDCNSCPS